MVPAAVATTHTSLPALPIALFDAASALVPGNAAPTWFGRAPLHAAVISCCVLPVARTRTRSLRVGGVRLPPAGFAVVVRRRPRGRAGAAASVAVVGILAEAVFLGWTPLVWRESTRSVASSSLSWLLSFSR